MNENIDIIEKPESNIIKHLVIAGGGPYACYIYYGILKESQKQGLWDIKNIKSIYGTSAGAILAVLLSLKYSWETMDNYVIKRPWQNVFKFD
jgi:predicted acylesterase/phospholipase RssA